MTDSPLSSPSAPPVEGPAVSPVQAPVERPWWRKALPFVLGGALLMWVFSSLKWSAFLLALSRVNFLAFGGFMVAFVFSLLVADVTATLYLYRKLVAPVRFRDFLLIRGASYLPSVLNYHVGQAWVTYMLSRIYPATLKRAAGSTLVVYATWVGCLIVFGLVGVVWSMPWTWWVLAPVVVGLLYLAVIQWRPARLEKFPLLAPLFETGVVGHIVAMLLRLPHLLVLFVGTYGPFLFFGIKIPLPEALTRVPILMLAVKLPLTPLGLGTRDALAPKLFGEFTSAPGTADGLAQLAACTTATAAMLAIVNAVIGAIIMRFAVRLIPDSTNQDG